VLLLHKLLTTFPVLLCKGCNELLMLLLLLLELPGEVPIGEVVVLGLIASELAVW
jgi:hypothetical protein